MIEVLELKLDNRNGNVWNISEIVSAISWKTSRVGRPGSLDFTLTKNALYQDKTFAYKNGDIVQLRKGNVNVFHGFIFEISEGSDDAVKIKAYDQIRYLMAKDTYVLENVTASEVVSKIAKQFQLKTGIIEDTGYKIPTMSEDGKKLIDIIDNALALTLINSGRNYVLYDDFGQLALRNVESLLLDFVIGDGSLMTEYALKTSIDQDTYNRIVLYKDNEKSGKRELHVTQDSGNIAKWGVLQFYESVDENMNDAQIRAQLQTLATLKNRETKSLKLSAIGDIRVRGGSYVRIRIEEYGINQPFLVDECSHSFDGADHTMTLELKVIA